MTSVYLIVIKILFSFNFFLIGAALASFFNVVGYRMDEGLDWTQGRSKCENCGRQIAWFDNIPVFSYLFLKGQCRHCHQKIDAKHLFYELISGVVFVFWTWSWFDFQLDSFFDQQKLLYYGCLTLFFIVLWAIFLIDLQYYIIPDFLVVILLVIAVFYRLILPLIYPVLNSKYLIHLHYDLLYRWHFHLILAVVFTVIFFLLWYLSKGKGFGFGDVKLVFPLVWLLGYTKGVVMVFLSFIFGSIIGILLLIIKKKKFGQVIPFGPFLVLGTIVAVFYGSELWSWYFGNFITRGLI